MFHYCSRVCGSQGVIVSPSVSYVLPRPHVTSTGKAGRLGGGHSRGLLGLNCVPHPLPKSNPQWDGVWRGSDKGGHDVK